MTSAPRLVLASGSPRRQELLRALGLAFEVRPADVDEAALGGEHPAETVRRLARSKIEAVAATATGALVLGADTLVVVDGAVLGKPRDTAEAAAMLGRLAGREHQVHTGVAVLDALTQRHAEAIVTSTVRMAPMSEEEIAWYVSTGEPLDKAGAYAIQGVGAIFVESVAGNYSNVVGLPLPAVRRLLAEVGRDWRAFRADCEDS